MKKVLPLIILLSVLCSCGPKKTNLKYGRIIRCSDGMMLPITKEPGKMIPEYRISLGFKPEGVYLQSDKMLAVCYISIVYDNFATQIDLDFIDRYENRYTYFISYDHLPSANKIDNVKQFAVYYVPEDVPFQEKEATDPDGNTFTYPNYDGYYFFFNQEEFKEYFQLMIQYIKQQ